MILGPDGRPVTAQRVVLEKQGRFNPCRGMTPEILTARLEGFAQGDLAPFAWTAEWIEQHDYTASVVADKAKRAVSRYGWDIQVPDDLDPDQEALAKEQAKQLKRFYNSIRSRHAINKDERGGMRLLTKQVMDGYGKGYSVHNVVWRITASGLEADTVHVPLWMFEATTGGLAFLKSWADYRGTPIEDMGGPGAWIVACGRGVMLATAICWQFKHIPLQDWLTYCDRHGMPGFLGKTSAEYGTVGWNAIAAAVRNMGAEYGAVVNVTDAIDVLDLTAKGNIPYEQLVDRMDRAITILWRGGDLGTISRGNAVGAQNQNEDTDDLDGDNSIWVGETLDQTLGRKVIDYYFGEDAPMLATLAIGSRTRDDQSKQLAATNAAVGYGLRVSKAWFSRKFGVPVARADETDVLYSASAPAATPVPVANAAQDIFASEISEALGLREEQLAPAKTILDGLMLRAMGNQLEDGEIERSLRKIREMLPGLVDPLSTSEMAAVLASAAAKAWAEQASDNKINQP